MSEQPYECRGELRKHAERVTWDIFERAGEPNELILRGYTRKSKRKFCAFADVGEWRVAEARAMAFIKEHGEVVAALR